MYKYSFVKRIFAIFVCGAILLSVCLSAAAKNGDGGAYSWYCMHAEDHQRPALDANLSWICEDPSLQTYYLDPHCSDQMSEENRVLYLTFDVGYENGNVSKILDTLKEKQVAGSFFILKNVVDREGDLLGRMFTEGHLVCNHTAHHPDMSKITDRARFAAEIDELDAACFEKTGYHTAPFYRPPQGCFTKQNLQWASEMGYHTVFWSFAYADWDNEHQPDPGASLEKIVTNVHNGAILLLHPTSATNAKILGDVIDRCRDMGYRFATLDQLLRDEENTVS